MEIPKFRSFSIIIFIFVLKTSEYLILFPIISLISHQDCKIRNHEAAEADCAACLPKGTSKKYQEGRNGSMKGAKIYRMSGSESDPSVACGREIMTLVPTLTVLSIVISP
jgi:hypothetical protein